MKPRNLFCFVLQEVVTGILPISYEDEIVQKRLQILRDPLQILLVFPEDDVVVRSGILTYECCCI